MTRMAVIILYAACMFELAGARAACAQTGIVCQVLSLDNSTYSNVVVYCDASEMRSLDIVQLRKYDAIARAWVYRKCGEIGNQVQEDVEQAHNKSAVVPVEFFVNGIKYSQYCKRFSFSRKGVPERLVIEYLDPRRYTDWKEMQPIRNGGFPKYFWIVIDVSLGEVIEGHTDPL